MSGTAVFQSTTLATPGPGIVVATDSVSGTLWQYVKVDIGAAGASSPVTSSNPLPVQGTVRTLAATGGLGESSFGTLFTAGVTNGTLIPAPASGTYTRVYDIIVNGSAAGTAFLEFGDGTVFAPVVLAANGGFVFNSARGVRTRGTSYDILFNAASGTWGVTVNYVLEN